MKELNGLVQTLRTMALGLAMMLLSVGLMLSGVVMSQRSSDPRISNNMMLVFYIGVFLLLVGFFKTIAGWKEGKDLLVAAQVVQPVPSETVQEHPAPEAEETSPKKPCTSKDSNLEDLKSESTLSEQEER